MPSSDGTSSSSSQKLKPKASKIMPKSSGGASGGASGGEKSDKSNSQKLAKSDGSVSKKSKPPRESALMRATDGPEPGLKKKTGSVSSSSTKSPKLSGKTSAKLSGSSAAVAESPSGSSTSLKVKKKNKSSTAGKALSPKKSSLRKTAPEAEAIRGTDDLEPVSVGDDGLDEVEEVEEVEAGDDTTVAYKEPPSDEQDADDSDDLEPGDEDRDGVTETYVLNKEDDDAEAEKGEDDEDAEGEASDKSDADADEKKDEDAAAASPKLKKGASARASKRLKSSKRTTAGDDPDADAKAAERTSRRNAEQKKAGRFRAKLFLFFAIGTVVLLILCGIVIWVKWGGRTVEEMNVYAVPAYAGESFDTLQSDFGENADPKAYKDFLIAQNPNIPADKPFEKDLRINVNIAKQWGRLNTDASFVQHFMGEVDKDLAKKPQADLPAAHRDMLKVERMLDRFVLKNPANTEETKKHYRQELEELKSSVTSAEREGGASGGDASTPTPTPPTSSPTPTPAGDAGASTGEDELAKARRLSALCNPIDANVMQAHKLIAAGDKDGGLAELKKALDLIDQLKSIATFVPKDAKTPLMINSVKVNVSDAKENKVINSIKKGEKILPLFDKAQGISVEDVESAFPETKPPPAGDDGAPDGPTEAK